MSFQWDIGIAMLCGYDDDGFPHVQPDIYGEKESGSDPFELHHMFGFLGMPDEPELDANGEPNPEKAAQVLYAWEGSLGHVFALGDPRFALKIPKLKKKGSVQYGGNRARPTFALIDGDSGSYTVYIPYAFTGTGDAAVPSKACTISVNVRNSGAESIEIVHGEGMAIMMAAGGKNSVTIKNKAGDASLEVNDDGVTINGSVKITGSVDIGGALVPVPFLLAGMVPSTSLKGK